MVTVALLMDEVILNQQFSLLLENNAESKQWLAITNLYGRTEIGTRLELKHPNVIYRWTLEVPVGLCIDSLGVSIVAIWNHSDWYH